MVTDRQVRLLMRELQTGNNMESAAAKAGMDEKSARKWRDLARLPSEVRVEHSWRTRQDPFEEIWEELEMMLMVNPGLEAITLFRNLQRKYPGRYGDGQLRTLQRKVKVWRALEGPPKEIYFPQVHHPGELCQSDFTHMGSLGITIQGKPFDHLLYHFVLTYSNWEWGMVCFSESFESLSEGLQNALWTLGAVPGAHRTDRLSTAVQKPDHPEEFTTRYRALMRHYGMEALKIQAGCPHENGDVEQSHNRVKKAIEQSSMLRGSSEFESREAYGGFLKRLFTQLNAGRRERFCEELKVMRQLPARRLESSKRIGVRVGPSSTIRVNHKVYSVHSRLIGEWVEVRLYMEHLEVWYAQRLIETIPRLRGKETHRIDYRHIIDWLIKKPGAFENYRYREDLFPSHRFRMAYDGLKRNNRAGAVKEYLKILFLAARESEARVDDILRDHLDRGHAVSWASVEAMLHSQQKILPATEVTIDEVDLSNYDALLETKEVCCG